MQSIERMPRWAAFVCAMVLAGVGCRQTQPDTQERAAAADGEDGSTKKKKKKKDKNGKKKKKDKKGKKDKKDKKDKKADDAPLPALDDGPIAIVAGQSIPRERLDELLELQFNSILSRRDDGQVPNPAQRHYRKRISQRLVWEELLHQETLASGVEYDKKELDAYLKRTTYADSADFLTRSLETAQSWNAKAVAHYRERAHLSKRASLEATDADIDASYEENKQHFDSPEERVWAAHILVAIGPRNAIDDKIIEPRLKDVEAATPEEVAKWDEMALAKANKLRKQVLASKLDFMDFAREHSEGPGAFRGGDMGVFDRKRMISEYSDVVFSLPVGQVSEPFKTDKGYFVAKVFGRWPGGVLPKEALVGELRRNIEERKYREAKQALERELYAKFPVQNRIYEALGEVDEKIEAAKSDAPKSDTATSDASKSNTAKSGATKTAAEPGKSASQDPASEPAASGSH